MDEDSKIIRIAMAGGLELEKRGGRYLALCQWHDDSNPSLSLNPQINSFYCFSCKISGGYVDLAARLGVVLADALGDAPAPAPAAREWPLAQKVARLPRDEVLALWRACGPVTADAEVSAWLRSRCLDPATIQDRDLARALPRTGQLHAWARYAGSSWGERPEAFRCILPLYSASGALEGLRARALRPDPAAGLKALAPVGGGATGLLLADDLGRRLLRGEEAARAYVLNCAPVGLVVAEGETDFLTWATSWSDAAEYAPALWGVVAGSWNAEHAARIPDGATVLIATDRDEAGDGYAAAILETLTARHAAGTLRVSRWTGRPT
jgi:hypothetical protein